MLEIKESLKAQIRDELSAREGLTINSKDEAAYHDAEASKLLKMVLDIEDREIRRDVIRVKEDVARMEFKASTIQTLEGLGRTLAGAGVSWGMFVAALEAEQVAAIWSRTHKIVGEFLRPLKW